MAETRWIRITYLAPVDEETGEAADFPYTIGWDETETFVQQMIRAHFTPDPITGERSTYDHGEYLIEETGERVYFHLEPDGTLVWEDEREARPTDVPCDECQGTGLAYVKRNPVTGRPYRAPKVVPGQSCFKCGGTGRLAVIA